MNRKRMIQHLEELAPTIMFVTGTSDMGYEFSAVVPGGVIYAMPGMLLNYSGGAWPPDQWEGKTEEEAKALLRDFLLDAQWKITPWEELGDEDIEQCLQGAKLVRAPR